MLERRLHSSLDQVQGGEVSSQIARPSLDSFDRLIPLAPEYRPVPGTFERLGNSFDPVTGRLNFAVHALESEGISGVDLIVFDPHVPGTRLLTVPMERAAENSFCIALEGVAPGERLEYAYRPRGSGVDADLVHVDDPRARLCVLPSWRREHLTEALEKGARPEFYDPPRSIASTAATAGTRRVTPALEPGKGFFYEISERFTINKPEVPRALQGTIAGLAHPSVIEHLKSLRANGPVVIQLMPILATMDELDLALKGRTNIWRYHPSSMFAPDSRIFHAKDPAGQLEELQTTVRILQEAGFWVIMDFVGGHTAEAKISPDPKHNGPTLNLRALGRSAYYLLDGNGVGQDLSNCGNTVNVAHPWGQSLVVDAMEYWCEIFDGLRVDQALLLQKHVAEHPVIAELQRNNKIFVAEPCDGWHAEHGSFPRPWREQNKLAGYVGWQFFSGHGYDYRGPMVAQLATEIAGNSNFYRNENRGVIEMAHDGFSLYDRTEILLRTLREFQVLPHEGDDERARFHLAQALFADMVFQRSELVIAAGTELLHSQNGSHNAFDDLSMNILEWPREDDPLRAERARFSNFVRHTLALRDELGVFDRLEHSGPGNRLFWLNAKAERVHDDRHWNVEKRDHARQFWADHENYFLGAIYSETFDAADDRQPERSTVFVARAGRPQTFRLPALANGYSWRLRADSTLDTQPSPDRSPEQIPCYALSLPGIAIFDLVAPTKRIGANRQRLEEAA